MNLKLLLLSTLLASASAIAQVPREHHKLAPTPPMGWNSWDCFGTSINEEQCKAQADAMEQKLKPFGWQYFVVDIQWYEPNAKGHGYKAGAPLEVDEFSRLVPATKKFPSAAGGQGFKPLADYVHGKGFKFGIHIMRGIARQAVNKNTPVLGTTVRAADIANTRSTCKWNPDMYGVDMSKPGAQEYYDSLFALYASWGVDFVKVDDIARPYDETQMAEIEAIRKAIDKTGRPMILSLSPGDTPIERGVHVSAHANMWRISDDFWDKWKPLKEMFHRLDKWTEFRSAGAWPDADMLPFGIIEFKRKTRFTPDEQILCMTLWSIARSPLILGADMTQLDDFTLSLLTNTEVLAVNQASTNNRQLFNKGGLIAWVADIPGSEDKYVGFFNTCDKKGTEAPAGLELSLELSTIGIQGTAKVRDLWAKKDTEATGRFAAQIPWHGAGLYRISSKKP
ncbi:MAG: glycoside hydrolase family 27 protein [Candidatus Methylacidiphilales bacterium]|nr:glycoside hydrolase family 27 protein [Candidatus Methylacidiphilales bacterium]